MIVRELKRLIEDLSDDCEICVEIAPAELPYMDPNFHEEWPAILDIIDVGWETDLDGYVFRIKWSRP